MAKQARRKAAQRNRNKTLWIGVPVILLVAALFVVWLQLQPAAETRDLPPDVSVADAAARRDAGAFILDVRQPEEWNEYHVPDSTLIPLGELASRVDELPRDQEIVVVCRSGNRSAQARDLLLEAGFTQITSMAGGLTEWRAAGFPTVSGP